MRRPIIHLVVALLTFAIGTISSLLFQKSPAPTPSSERANRQLLITRTELRALNSESVSQRCGCASDESSSAQPGLLISGGILNGKAISLPAPPYPAIARAARASGTVKVQVIVNEKGCVQSARAASGHPLLQAAAVQAAKQACFTPTLLSGKSVKVSGVVTYNFALQ
jgi:TonB family protein